MHFDGHTYDPKLDQKRLSTQYMAVWNIMIDGQWHTESEIRTITNNPAGSGVTARFRDFRKKRFGAHTVERERVPGKRGLHKYKLTPRPRPIIKDEDRNTCSECADTCEKHLPLCAGCGYPFCMKCAGGKSKKPVYCKGCYRQ